MGTPGFREARVLFMRSLHYVHIAQSQSYNTAQSAQSSDSVTLISTPSQQVNSEVGVGFVCYKHLHGKDTFLFFCF